MYQTSALLFFYNETPLHPGTGTGIGDVDRPIQREVHTQLPVIHDSGVKGATRHDVAEVQGAYDLERAVTKIERTPLDERTEEQEHERKEKLEALASFEAVFGPNVGTGREHEHGGALGFSDARILLFPVRSLRGIFAWVTCPFVLGRLRRDLFKVASEVVPEVDDGANDPPSLPAALASLDALLSAPPPDATAWASDSCPARVDYREEREDDIVLESLAFTCPKNHDASGHVETVGHWLAECALPAAEAFDYMKKQLSHSLVVVPDEVFRDFTLFSTQIVTRIRIGETGTVVEGALWNEEHLPSDCLLYSLTPAMRSTRRNAEGDGMDAEAILGELIAHLDKHPVIQFGGGKSLTRGLTQVTLQTNETLRSGRQNGRSAGGPASGASAPPAEPPASSSTDS